MTFSIGTYIEKATFPHEPNKGKRSVRAEVDFDVSEARKGRDMLTQSMGSKVEQIQMPALLISQVA